MIRRLPIRLKLTLAFTIAMAAVLTATAFFLYLRLRTELDNRIDQNLHTRLQVVSARLQNGGGGRRSLARAVARGEEGSGVVELLPAGGTVLGAREAFGDEPLLSAAELRRLAASGGTLDLQSEQPELGPVRVLVRPVEVGGRRVTVAVGATLEDRNEALANLRALLLVGEPVALLLAALAAYAVIGAALRPVDRMLRRLQEGLNRERTFVADASHELRTPLTMLKTELELMRTERPVGAQFDEAVEAAIGDTDRLARLTDDLLVLARADRQRLPLNREEVDVRELLETVASRYPRGRVEVAPTPAAGAAPETISADPARLEQALGNLVDNALRHGAAPVLLSATSRDGKLELHVSDQGPGFPPQFLDHAFDRFSQADPGDAGSGSGLGLSITLAIAEAHGGRARARNLGTSGADVWIEIPTTHEQRPTASPNPSK